MPDREAKKKFMLGTAIKISTVISQNTASSAIISIKDPNETAQVSDANMTKEANKIYSYIYQSDEDDLDGDYIITIEITYGAYTSVIQDYFTLVEQE